MAATAKFEEKNRKAVQTIQSRAKEMQNYTDRICNQLNMSAAARTAAERAYKSAICGKRWLIFRRHSDEERVFVRMLLRLALATDPNLVGRADEVANYIGANYGFEWVSSEITATVREEARTMVASAGESSFGASGSADGMAFARCHHKTLKHEEVGDFGKTYALGARLASDGDFHNKHDEWRKELGMDRHRNRREGIIGSQEQGEDEM